MTEMAGMLYPPCPSSDKTECGVERQARLNVSESSGWSKVQMPAAAGMDDRRVVADNVAGPQDTQG
jgi:hypothetical protein